MSIRLRLALWCGALFALILPVVALLTYAIHARRHSDSLHQALITSAGHAVGEATAMGVGPHLVERPDQLEVLRLDGLAFDPVVCLLPSLVVPLPIPGERIFRLLPNP